MEAYEYSLQFTFQACLRNFVSFRFVAVFASQLVEETFEVVKTYPSGNRSDPVFLVVARPLFFSCSHCVVLETVCGQGVVFFFAPLFQ